MGVDRDKSLVSYFERVTGLQSTDPNFEWAVRQVLANELPPKWGKIMSDLKGCPRRNEALGKSRYMGNANAGLTDPDGES